MRREHVVLFDRSRFRHFLDWDGAPLVDPRHYRITLVAGRDQAAAVPGGLVDRVIETDAPEKTELLVRALAGGPAVDRVAALSETLLLPAASLRDRLGVPGFSASQMTVFRDKPAMKRHYAARDIRVPDFQPVSRPADALDLLRKHGTVVLKPVDGLGSRGVTVVPDESRLRALDAAGFGAGQRYLAEEFVDGEQFHIDSVVDAGRPTAVMVSRYLGSSIDLRIGGTLGSVNLDPGPEEDELRSFNTRVLRETPWFSGATHLEVFRRSDGEIVFCEIAGRAGGGGVIPSFHHRFGVGLHRLALLPQLGRPLPVPAAIERSGDAATGWSIIYPPALGVLTEYAAPCAEPWLLDLTWLRKPGDVLTVPHSIVQGIAITTVCGPDSATVEQRLETVRQGLRVTVTPS